MTTTGPITITKKHPSRNFMLGEGISLAGSQIGIFVIPLLAVELLDSSPFELGILTMVEYIPFVLLALFFGAIVDHVQPRSTLLVTNVARLVILAVIGLLVLTVSLNYLSLLALVFLLSTASTLFDLSLQSAVPLVIDKKNLGRANGRFEIIRSSGQTFAPPLAGFVFSLGGAWLALLTNAITYIAGVWASRAVPTVERAQNSDAPTFINIFRSMKQGLAYILRERRDLVGVIGAATLSNLASGALAALQSVYLLRDLGLSPFLLGVSVALAGLVGLVGATVGGRLSDRLGHVKVMLIGLMASALAIMLLAAPASGWDTLLITLYVGLVIGIVAAGNTVFNIAMISFRQTTVPQELLGRVNAAARAAIMSGVPIGAFIGGLVANQWGVRPSLVALAGLAILGVAAIIALQPRRKTQP